MSGRLTPRSLLLPRASLHGRLSPDSSGTDVWRTIGGQGVLSGLYVSDKVGIQRQVFYHRSMHAVACDVQYDSAK
jgi:hypothetical protein